MLEPLSRRRWVIFGVALLTVFVLLIMADPAFAQPRRGRHRPRRARTSSSTSSSRPAWLFGPMLIIMSVVLIALCVLLVLDLRMSVAIPPGFVDEFIDTVNKRRFKEAFDMARNDTSFLGRVLTAGMSRLQYGLEDAREAAQNMLESIRSGKEQLNNYTAVIGSLGPLIGLVGTVLGMIRSFQVLASGTAINASKLAEGHRRGPVDHVPRDRRVGAGHLLQRLLPEPDREGVDGHRAHRRRPADADVPQLEESGRDAAERRGDRDGPAAGPGGRHGHCSAAVQWRGGAQPSPAPPKREGEPEDRTTEYSRRPTRSAPPPASGRCRGRSR